ncbi:MAG TPA: hypothetical protein V6C65_04430 [Allocoleopsis sp.]
MRYFIDCEFDENGKTIELISIGITCEDGRDYYAISTEFNPKKCSQWVKDNVLNTLPPRFVDPVHGSPRLREEAQAWKSRDRIAIEVLAFLKKWPVPVNYQERSWFDKLWYKRQPLQDSSDLQVRNLWSYRPNNPIEVWSEWGSYDWVTLCQLFGTMMDLPRGFPMRIRDIIQLAEDELGIPSHQLPPSLETEGNHNALLGAKTVQMRYDWLIKQKNEVLCGSSNESAPSS